MKVPWSPRWKADYNVLTEKWECDQQVCPDDPMQFDTQEALAAFAGFRGAVAIYWTDARVQLPVTFTPGKLLRDLERDMLTTFQRGVQG